MLHIEIPDREYFNDETSEFITLKAVELDMEHSLISLSKWESKWHKPFLDNENLTKEEMIDYFKCMTVSNRKIDPIIYHTFPAEVINEINDYIENPMTATWFSDSANDAPSREIITSEIFYYWMLKLNIPFECEKWHINRLLTLIRVCSIKDAPKKKMSNSEIMERNRRLNEERKKKMNTAG